MNCPSCNTPNAEGYRFCANCGGPLPEAKAKRRRWPWAVLATVVVVAVAACAAFFVVGDDDSNLQSGDALKTTPVSELSESDAAVVNGVAISRATYERALSQARALDANAKDPESVTMTTLIENEWAKQEAERLGIAISPAAVDERFETLKQQSFPEQGDYEKFLKQGETSESELKALVEISMTNEQLDKRWGKTPVITEDQLREEYESHKSDYNKLASRDMLLIFNASESKVIDARDAIENGATFDFAATEYSQDSVSREQGGAFNDVTEGQFPSSLDKAVFSASKGELVGPIKTQYGYYLFKITGITEESGSTFESSREAVKDKLTQGDAASRTKKARAAMKKRWRAATTCAADLVVASCSNYSEAPSGE